MKLVPSRRRQHDPGRFLIEESGEETDEGWSGDGSASSLPPLFNSHGFSRFQVGGGLANQERLPPSSPAPQRRPADGTKRMLPDSRQTFRHVVTESENFRPERCSNNNSTMRSFDTNQVLFFALKSRMKSRASQSTTNLQHFRPRTKL